jgi:hypothetical protein
MESRFSILYITICDVRGIHDLQCACVHTTHAQYVLYDSLSLGIYMYIYCITAWKDVV